MIKKYIVVLFPLIFLSSCLSTSGILDELNQLKDEYAKKQIENNAEIEKGRQLLNGAYKNAEELKKQITSLNKQNEEIDAQRNAIAIQLAEIIKIKNPGDLLNVFVLPTLKFLLSLARNIASKWFWAIFWYAVFVGILTEILGFWLLAWPKPVISIIPLIIVFPLTLWIQKADLYCGIALAILSWGVAHAGWTMLVNWFKAYVPVVWGIKKVLSPNIASAIARFGEARMR